MLKEEEIAPKEKCQRKFSLKYAGKDVGGRKYDETMN